MRGVSRENAVQIIIFYILRCIIASPIIVPFVSSSSSVNRNNYNVYNYDQTTPQFTPDGRLLQVEYASSAADLSPPLVVLEFFDDDHSHEDNESLAYPCTVLITIPKQPSSPQNRIIIIEKNNPDDQPNSSLQRNRNPRNRSYCVAMSGILADSLALLQEGMKVAAEHSLQYQDSLGMESLTQALADECQSRVFAGGLRPYGSTLLLCGYDDRIIDDDEIVLEEEGDNKINIDRKYHRRKLFQSLIYQTDPSGGILQHHAQDSEDNERIMRKTVTSKSKQSRRPEVAVRNNVVQGQVRCIVGGSSSFQRQLHKQINQGMIKFEQRKQSQQRNRKESSLSLADRIANVARILIKETGDSDGTTNRSSNSRSKSRNSKENGLSSSNYPLEVVIVSPRLGCHRLEGKQLRAIQEIINTYK
jgi:hypothetical protein